jgi:hypothetical protein
MGHNRALQRRHDRLAIVNGQSDIAVNRRSQLLVILTSRRQTSPNSFFPSVVIVHSTAIASSPIKAMLMGCSGLTTRNRPLRNYRSPKIPVDCAPGWKFSRQRPPLAAGPQQVKYRIDHSPAVDPSSAEAFLRRQQRLNNRPLIIRQIRCVSATIHPRLL